MENSYKKSPSSLLETTMWHRLLRAIEFAGGYYLYWYAGFGVAYFWAKNSDELLTAIPYSKESVGRIIEKKATAAGVERYSHKNKKVQWELGDILNNE